MALSKPYMDHCPECVGERLGVGQAATIFGPAWLCKKHQTERDRRAPKCKRCGRPMRPRGTGPCECWGEKPA